jgi:hypothetical protein
MPANADAAPPSIIDYVRELTTSIVSHTHTLSFTGSVEFAFGSMLAGEEAPQSPNVLYSGNAVSVFLRHLSLCTSSRIAPLYSFF